MKKVKNILAAAIIGCALLNPVKVYAYDINPSLAVVEESKNNINLKVEDTNSIVKSFQVSFKVDGAKVDSIKWSEKIKDNGKADFKDNNGLITVYVTSKVNLVETDGSLNIGTIVVRGNNGDKFTITPNNMKLVTLNNKSVTASSVAYDGDAEFYTEGKDLDNKPVPSPIPGENSKPEETVKPDGNGSSGDDNVNDSDNSSSEEYVPDNGDSSTGSGSNDSDKDNGLEDSDINNDSGDSSEDSKEEISADEEGSSTEASQLNKTEKKKNSTSLKTGDYLKVGGLFLGLGVSAAVLCACRKGTYTPKH